MNDNLKEALAYAVELAVPTVYEHEALAGFYLSDKPLKPINLPTPPTIITHTLAGLCALIKSERAESVTYVRVVSPTEVIVTSPPRSDMSRVEPLRAVAELPTLAFDKYRDMESFLIMLKARYMPNTDRDELIALLGTISEEDVRTASDDGITQVVTARTGIAQVGNARITPIRVLRPYRTFLEVDQPESEFLLRMQTGPTAALFEADGGAWRLAAVKSIAEFLAQQLEGYTNIVVVR